ncbi:Yip1 domain-containing protein [Ruminococcus sp. YE71]|uniref:Yip1 family protein n=1 Tax=unclassified Ruminococcus TaxID=2608920 RepID=UPI00087F5499|nr:MULTISPECIES: Yip1 family protein [unclassified Ruminococcus]SDA14698.1 Yip1 domain-containing protein [Ruminococcus sp. YE78]SFW21355.1 Yip1 domain-containing protein [Ruminococcus sp. YE71]
MDSMYNFSTLGWVSHVCFHPTEGFEDLRWKKKGSIGLSFIIVALLFVAMVAKNRMVGFAFNTNTVKVFNVVPLIVQSVIYFATWVIGNWCICTLLDGEGTLKRICIFSAYALVPFILCTCTAVLLSNFLILEEQIWFNFFYYLGIGWSVVLMISAMKAVHQYSLTKTIISIVLTLVAMLLILFLAILLLSLFQQVYVFVYTIYTEIAYRIRG